MRQHLRQAAIGYRGLVEVGTDQRHAPLGEPGSVCLTISRRIPGDSASHSARLTPAGGGGVGDAGR
jgi:hypothetical protein